MKQASFFFVLLVCCSAALYAQPRWSPEIRSAREVRWMEDSLHITQNQVSKISGISLDYQRNMDKAAELPDKKRKQARLMHKKDAAYKRILNKEQYAKYYKRELLIRKQETIIYKGHQPL